MKHAMKKRCRQLFRVLPVLAFLSLCSCVSIAVRLESRNGDPPRIYPGTVVNVGLISEIKPPLKGYQGFYGLTVALSRLFGGIAIIDFPFSFVLDTVLLPTDLLFGPGAIIAEEPSGSRLLDIMKSTAYNAYREIAEGMGVRYKFQSHRYGGQNLVRIFAFTLDSEIESFSGKEQVLFEVRHTTRYWNDEEGRRILVYSVFWLNPKNQKLLFRHLPAESDSIQSPIFTSSRKHAKSIRKHFSERMAVAACDTRLTFPSPNYRYVEGSWISGAEATNAVRIAREKYREITGDYPGESLDVYATEKFVLFGGDTDPPPKSLNTHRVEVLITEPSPSPPNNILKAMFWIDPTTHDNPVVEVLYPINRHSRHSDPLSRNLEPKEIADRQNKVSPFEGK